LIVYHITQAEERLWWVWHVARMGLTRNACRILVEKPLGKCLLGELRRIWEDDIKMGRYYGNRL
jgi:hypothetical protein